MKSLARLVIIEIAAMAFLALNVSVRGAQTAKARQLEHGKYLVEDVAGCTDCHSPHNQKGELVPGEELQGAELDFQPIHPVPGWAGTAPPIAGLSILSTADAMKLLTKGLAPDGKPPAPPMPQYHMTRADAAAVIAYLKSLKPARK